MGHLNPHEANDAGCSADEIGVLGWCDFNVPFSRSRENCNSLCKGMASLHEANPAKSCSVLILPDNARESSLRGLFDEERQIMEELFSLAQACDARWVEVFARESRKADRMSNTRKFGTGRIVASSTMLDQNEWMNSELAVYGRVVGANELTEGAPLALLPRTASILIPESASPVPWFYFVFLCICNFCNCIEIYI